MIFLVLFSEAQDNSHVTDRMTKEVNQIGVFERAIPPLTLYNFSQETYELRD